MFRRLRDLRENQNLGQRHLSKMLDINYATYNHYENDKAEPPLPILIKIAKYYNTSLDYLLELTNNKESYKPNETIKDIRLKELRKNKKLTQVEIADILNVNQSAYNHYETGRRTIPYDSLIKLSNYYNTSVDYLLGLTDIKESHKKTVLTR